MIFSGSKVCRVRRRPDVHLPDLFVVPVDEHHPGEAVHVLLEQSQSTLILSSQLH